MTKVELVAYVANLASLHDYFEDFGIEHLTIEAELSQAHDELNRVLKGEHDEARTRGQRQDGFPEGRAQESGGKPRGSRSDGSGDGESKGG